MKIISPFQIFSTKSQKAAGSTLSGKLWINYTKEINSLKPTDSQNVNIAIKIVVYITTIVFVIITAHLALISDAVSYLYSSIYSLHGEGKADLSTSSLVNKLSIGSIGVFSLLAGVYALRFYGIAGS